MQGEDFQIALTEKRAGRSPLTQRLVPHRQLTEYSPKPIFESLASQVGGLPGVGERESRMGEAQTRAFWISDALANGPREAFIDDHEFCHLHEGGFLHLSLPRDVRERVVRLGWGEVHPAADAGFVPATWTMVYAPRDIAELTAVTELAITSHRFATGGSILKPESKS
jgi:hypothetical protein